MPGVGLRWCLLSSSCSVDVFVEASASSTLFAGKGVGMWPELLHTASVTFVGI